MIQEQTEKQVHLEWMLQNGMVEDHGLAQALAIEFSSDMLQMSMILGVVEAKDCVLQAILSAVERRHRYTGEVSLKAWLFSLGYGAFKRRGRPLPEYPEVTLFMFLRYAQDFTIPEICHILGMREKKVVRMLDQGRHLSFESWGPALEQADLPLGHGKFLLPMHAARDGLLGLEETHLLEAHLCECAPCKRYSGVLAEQEEKWRETTSIAWPRGFLSGKELDEICKMLENGVSEKGMRRRYSLSIKEISLTATAILVVAVIGLASGMLQPGRAPSSPQQTRIVYNKVTRTPRPAPTSTPEHPQNLDLHAQATATRSSVRAWSNGVFIDLGADSDRFPSLSGDQIWSSSGPVALALVLQYWDWKENPLRALEWLKPNPRDENVMVYEIVNFVENNTRFKVLSRVGGNVELLQDLTHEGYPVIVETSKQVDETEGWVGRYLVVLGYDKRQGTIALLLNSSGVDEELVEVESFKEEWRAFNYNFLVVYPESEENQLMRTLGPYADSEASARLAAELASNEIYSTEGVDRFFAWFNRGSSLADLDDYGGAAKAYDEAFSLYAALTESQRPWRILWYQTRPYWAYYYTGRFSDLIDLTTSTLKAVQDPVLEESYYWRAMARAALGDEKAAITDLRKAVEVNPHFVLGLEQLSRLAE